MTKRQDIIDNLSTGVVVLDSGLRIVSINSAAQAMLEASDARSLNQNAEGLCSEPDQLIATLRQVADGRVAVARRGMSFVLHSGHTVQMDLFASPLLSDGKLDGLLLELQPVDRLQRISRDEGMMQAQETTRAVIRGLAHEIKNPLGGVRGAAQLLARELPDNALGEYTQIIIREADRLRDLVDRLLGPHQQLQLKPINAHEVLEHVRNLIQAESEQRITISRDYDPSIPDLLGDRAQLVQAVLNIMRNAMQAAESPEQCQICIRTRSQRQFTIGTQRHRIACRIDITDNGPGIPPDLLPSIFIPMVTGRAEGTGLGLSIAHAIVSRHGGLLACKSEPGRTRFTIHLPTDYHNDKPS